MSFLPKGYENLISKKNYLKLVNLEDGPNKIRIVMNPICGWIEWINKKPMRYREDQKPKTSFDPTQPLKGFWTTYIWDYAKEDLYVLEMTQPGVIATLIAFAKDPDIGAPTEYDLKIIKEGQGQNSRYKIMPLTPKPLSEKIIDAMESCPVRLDALFEGGDPWLDLIPLKVHKLTGEPIKPYNNESGFVSEHASIKISGNKQIYSEVHYSETDKYKLLKGQIKEEGIDISAFEKYLEYLSEQKKEPVQKIIETALEAKHYEMIKKSYAKYLTKQSNE